MRGQWWDTLAGTLVVCVCMLVAATCARAATMTLQASETAVLENPEQAAERRLLVRFEIPEHLSTGIVEIALLEFRTAVSAGGSSGGVTLDCFPVTTSWTSGSVDWSQGWSSPGGDYDASSHALCAAAVGDSSLVTFDVTDMVAGWAAEDTRNHGLIIAAAPSEVGGLQIADGAADTDGYAAQLTIWYAPRGDE